MARYAATMAEPDLNLLIALDALLAEQSVTAAAQRLGLSTSAMSRTLKRLREATGDPLLVRAGRGLVPTPYAETLGGPARETTRRARRLLQPPAGRFDLTTLDRLFTLRTNAAFVRLLGTALIDRVAGVAPRARLRFAPKPDKTAAPMRDGQVDLEIGVLDWPTPEIRTERLFDDRYIAVVRAGHPTLATTGLSADAFASSGHVAVSIDGQTEDPIERIFLDQNVTRDIRVVVPDFTDALRIVRQSDWVAIVPRSCLGNALVSADDHIGELVSFSPPIDLPSFTVHLQWHPRMAADPAHRWLRGLLVQVCAEAYPPG